TRPSAPRCGRGRASGNARRRDGPPSRRRARRSRAAGSRRSRGTRRDAGREEDRGGHRVTVTAAVTGTATSDARARRARIPRRATGHALVLLGYAAIAFVYFGLRLATHPGRGILGGAGNDSQIFVWSFAWWPHAIETWQNPFVSHAIFAPD